MASNPLAPTPALLCKLGSLIVHAEEAASPERHQFDVIAFKELLRDPEVVEWMRAMSAMAMLPVKRKRPDRG